MPDWTYVPLRGVAARVLGEQRSRRMALGFLAALARRRVTRPLVSGLGHTLPPQEAAREFGGVVLAAPVGALVAPDHAAAASAALPPLGAAVVAVAGPDGSPELDGLAGRLSVTTIDDPDPAAAVQLLAGGADVVLATESALVEAGPGWFARVTAAALGVPPAAPRPTFLVALRAPPWRWQPWQWGVGLGIGMLAGALGAAVVTLGPVLLPYDAGHLGMDAVELEVLAPALLPFLQHDRISLAGTMAALGVLYVALGYHGLRLGRGWARTALLASGLVGFPTLLFFLGYRYIEPLHLLLTAILLPMWIAAVRGRLPPRAWRSLDSGPEADRRSALLGQLLLLACAFGIAVGGAAIAVVGLTGVFVPSDLVFLDVTALALDGANPRLLGFIAHDRAGFGGALLAAGVTLWLLVAWGWGRGQSWLWWTLALAAAGGFLPAIVVHWAVGYTDQLHLAPTYLGLSLSVGGLALSRRWLCATLPASR